MRFCKFVPLDTFSIIQSLRKSSGTSMTPSAPCLDPENNLFPSASEGKPAAFCLEGSPHLKSSFLALHHLLLNRNKSISDIIPVAKLVLPKDPEPSSLSLASCLGKTTFIRQFGGTNTDHLLGPPA